MYRNKVEKLTGRFRSTSSPNDFTCDYRYIKDAAEPWPDPDGRIVLTWPAGSGRYHDQCRRILAASRVLDAAAAFTIFRPFLQMLPVFTQTFVQPSLNPPLSTHYYRCALPL